MRKRYGSLNVLLCMLLIVAFAGCAGSEKTKSTGDYIDDAAITAKINAEYAKDPELSAIQINVDTYKGAVQLSGFVDSARTKTKAGEVASQVKGVKSVKNNLVVK